MYYAIAILLCIFLFFFGAAVYSFLNVVIFRVPRGEEFVKTRSHCPGCGRVLTPLELVPVVSYVCLGGKCKNCGSKIGLRDVSIEVFGGLSAIACVAFAAYVKIGAISLTDQWLGINFLTLIGLFDLPLVNLIYGVMFKALAYFCLISILTVICFINIDTGKFHAGTLIAYGIVGVYGFFAMPTMELKERLIALAGGAVLFVLAGILLKQKSLFACAAMAGITGGLLGWRELLAIAAVAVVLGSIVAFLLLLTGSKKLENRFKPIPILSVSIVIGLFFGTWLANTMFL